MLDFLHILRVWYLFDLDLHAMVTPRALPVFAGITKELCIVLRPRADRIGLPSKTELVRYLSKVPFPYTACGRSFGEVQVLVVEDFRFGQVLYMNMVYSTVI